jgi:predicted regulator of Ras-like GTPase activity (Roadblock/LC7/MglB family)
VIDAKVIDEILKKIIKGETGIRKVILVDRTGLTISHVSKFSYYPVDVDGIGAIASAVFIASEEQGNNLKIGGLGIVTSEFETGKIFAASAGKGILCVITDESVHIGMIRFLMKEATEDLTKVLDEFLSVDSTDSGVSGTGPTDATLKDALADLERT